MPAPQDRGWSWVVAFAVLFNNTVMVGLVNVSGLIYIEMVSLFNASDSMVSFIIGFRAAMFSLFAVVGLGIFNEFLHSRLIIMVGGICACVGFVSSFGATRVEHMFAYAIMAGAGHSLIYGPGIVMVGKYFNKRRSFGNGLAVSGTSLGTLIFPYFMTFLIEEYAFLGAMLVCGGICLNCVVAGFLCRPVEFYDRDVVGKTSSNDDIEYKGVADESEDVESNDIEKTVNPLADLPDVVVIDKTSEEENTHKDICNMNHDLSVMANQHIRTEGDGQDRKNIDDIDAIQNTNNSNCPTFNDINTMPVDDKTVSDVCTEKTNPEDDPSKGRRSRELSGANNIEPCGESEITKYVDIPLDADEPEDATEKAPYSFFFSARKGHRKKKITDLSLMKKPLFVIFQIASAIYMVTVTIQAIFLPAVSKEHGLNRHEITILLSLLGLTDFIGRLFFGYLGDSGWIERKKIFIFTCTVIGIMSCTISLFTGFWLLLFYHCLYGFLSAGYPTLMPVTLVDLFGLENMSRSLSTTLLLKGVIQIGLSPALGYIKDKTGSFSGSFALIGGLLLGGSAIFVLIIMPLISRQEKTKITITDDHEAVRETGSSSDSVVATGIKMTEMT